MGDLLVLIKRVRKDVQRDEGSCVAEVACCNAFLSYKVVDTKPRIFPARCYIVLPNIGLYYVSGFFRL